MVLSDWSAALGYAVGLGLCMGVVIAFTNSWHV